MKHYSHVTGQNYQPPSRKHWRWECSCGAVGPYRRSWRQAFDGQKRHHREQELKHDHYSLTETERQAYADGSWTGSSS